VKDSQGRCEHGSDVLLKSIKCIVFITGKFIIILL